ncbi:DIS3-like exonuclease 2 [Taenia solium]|eukprot:TsM_000827000 transcript=TsM_000827000 gene=TsM_000827000
MTKSSNVKSNRNSDHNRLGNWQKHSSESLGNQNGKQKYEPYWDEVAVADGISSGQLLIGQLRINPKNYVDAYINHPKGDADVFIPGTRARNRSLNGDMVVVRLEPLKNWRVYDSFLSEKTLEWASTARVNLEVGKATFITVGGFFRQDPDCFAALFANITHGLKNHFESWVDPINLSDEPAANISKAARLPWWQLIQRVGRVVAIHRRLNCRICVGYLRPLPPSSSQKQRKSKQKREEEMDSPSASGWQLALLTPTDSRMCRIVIPRSFCPQDFVRQPETFKLVRFVAQITDWPEDSLHAKGRLIRRFDEETMSYIDAETDRILVNAGFALGVEMAASFPEAVETYVSEKVLTRSSPADLAAEYARRRDFRSQCVFTIDPRTARDLDDALHVRRLPPSEVARLEAKGVHGAAFEVGVHIADVSFYVRPEDPVDVEAASRATSIYLVHLCVPMLPRGLCEDLCSLHPGDDKFTFSVVFLLTKDARILTKWFGRAIIHSRAKLSYEDAQALLDYPNRDWQPCDLANLEDGADVREICRGVLILNELAVKMRARRFEGGALQLNQVKPTFTLAETTGLPVGMAPFIVRPANRLVEEWMLAANEAVADLLASRLPRTAFLRRHPPPTSKQAKDARSLLRIIGVDVNVTSAATIQNSLNRLSGCVSGTSWQHSDNLAELCASMMGCAVESSDSNAATVKAETAEEARLLATLNILTRCMNLAEYYCLGAVPDQSANSAPFYTSHYALNMTNYTHFTSPIRRYADLIVHRQLALILATASEKANSLEVAKAYRATCAAKVLARPDQLAALADHCNARKLDSRRASEESVEVFFTVFVKECGPLTEACSVVSVLKNAFDVLILSAGLMKRVYLNRLDLRCYEYEEAATGDKGVVGAGVLHLQWNVRPSENTLAPESFATVASPPSPLLSDPAVLNAVPALAGGDAQLSPSLPAPCGCFRQELHLFDLCRCLVVLDETSPSKAEKTIEVDTTNNSFSGNSGSRFLKLKYPSVDKLVVQLGLDVVLFSCQMRVKPVARLKFLIYKQCLVSITRFKSAGRLCYTSENAAYVVNPSDGNRILIFAKALNRALPNDIVAVKLNRPEQWRVRAFLEDHDDRLNRTTSPIIPAEAEEEFLDESDDDLEPSSSTVNNNPTTTPHFQLTMESGPGWRGSAAATNGGAEVSYPTVREVLQTSPLLMPRLFPGASSVLALQEQKPLSPLPSRYLLRTGRVVGVLAEDSASRRLVGSLVFESALLLPSAFVEAEGLDEFTRPRQGVVEGRDGLPMAKPVFFATVTDTIELENLWENPHKAEGVRILCGQIGDPREIEPATQEILLSHGIYEDEFTEDMLKGLPASEEEFQIPNYEYLRRRDFRSHCVVSVDPSTAKDLDDALHVKISTKDVFEVGVHIADVSFFVRPLTPLDQEAANRTTSIYLVQRVIPMLPAILSERLCSLNPGVDRLTFSVVFKVDKEGNVLDVWFGRSVIRSCARLSYEDATALLETPHEELDSLASRISVQGPFSLSNIKRSITYLDMLAQKMRKRRIENGALMLDKVQLQFDLIPNVEESKQFPTSSKEAVEADAKKLERNGEPVGPSQAGWPRGYVVKQSGRAHRLIEEWMLAANQAVARRLFHHVIRQKHQEILHNADVGTVTTPTVIATIGSSSTRPTGPERSKGLRASSMGTILRRHPAPKVSKIEELVKIASSAGISVDTSSGGAIRASLDAYIARLREESTPESEVESISTALSYLTYMRMQMALYFNVEDVVDRAIRKARNGEVSEVSPLASDAAEAAHFPPTSHESWESSLLKFSHHFGLNVPLYTHFTSPIRRYADLLVHRQLADLLGCGHWSCRKPSISPTPSTGNTSTVACAPRRPTAQAAWCNRMRRETRRAQEESQQLFLAAWIKSSGSVQENAVVLGLGNTKIQLLVPSCGLVLNHQLQKFCRKATSWQMESDRGAKGDATHVPCVTVRWEEGKKEETEGNEKGKLTASTTTKLSVLSVCPVRLTCGPMGFYVKAELLPPSNPLLPLSSALETEQVSSEDMCTLFALVTRTLQATAVAHPDHGGIILSQDKHHWRFMKSCPFDLGERSFLQQYA